MTKSQSKTLGFQMKEVMTGEHSFEPGFGPKGSHFMEFQGVWGPKNLKDWVNRKSENFMKQPLEGTVTIEGLCEDVPMKGSLTLDYFGEHKIRYDFKFKVGAKGYHFVGEKINIKPWNLPVSHTTCYGRLVEEKTGKLVSTSTTYFKFSTLPQFLGSLRFVWNQSSSHNAHA